jgi:macrolide transport system ATP-binding/permease protein
LWQQLQCERSQDKELSFDTIQLENISFSYAGAEKPILSALSLTIPVGWSGIVGRNGCGKTTLLHLVAGSILPSHGVCKLPGRSALCAQRSDTPPERFAEFLEDASRDAWKLKVSLSIQEDYLLRWDTLSHGERKRSQVAVALWEEPQVLLLDEPTNHLDSKSRGLLVEALRRFKGVGLLVSHDRELLNSLCDRCVCFENTGIIVRPGTFDQARGQRTQERLSALHHMEQAKHVVGRLSSEIQRKREIAARAKRKNSKKHISHKDHDAKERIDRARVTGKDAKLSNALGRLAKRLELAEQKVKRITPSKELALGVKFSASSVAHSRLISLTPGSIQISSERVLHHPSITIAAQSRVGISGSNGAGKSSFLAHIARVSGALAKGAFYLPQEISEREAALLHETLFKCDHAELGRILGIVGRLGSDPKALRSTRCLSPGEARKLLIAQALSRSAPMLILDEPTNHLDLDAALCLEKALNQYDGAVIVISHDDYLLRAITHERWVVADSGQIETGLGW